MNRELFVWQQPNAYADNDVIDQYYSLLRKLADDKPMLVIADAAKCHWSEDSKRKAYDVRSVGVRCL